MSFYTTAPTEIIDLVLEYAEWDPVLEECTKKLLEIVESGWDAEEEPCGLYLCNWVWEKMMPTFTRVTFKWSSAASGDLHRTLVDEMHDMLSCAFHLVFKLTNYDLMFCTH